MAKILLVSTGDESKFLRLIIIFFSVINIIVNTYQY